MKLSKVFFRLFSEIIDNSEHYLHVIAEQKNDNVKFTLCHQGVAKIDALISFATLYLNPESKLSSKQYQHVKSLGAAYREDFLEIARNLKQ